MKIDLKKVNLKKSATWNIWNMLSINIDKITKKIDVTTYYIPEKEQQKLIDYMLKNYTKLKEYKYTTKTNIKKQMAWERLCYFPSSVNKNAKNI